MAKAKGDSAEALLRRISKIPMPEEPASVRRRRLRAARQPKPTLWAGDAAELAIEQRETALVRHIPAWKGRELWCTGVTPDGIHYAGKVENAPRSLIVDSYTAKEVILRPGKSYQQRRLSWLAQLARSGMLEPEEGAAASRWRDDWLGSNTMPGSILDPDRTFGGAEGFPVTRLETAADHSISYDKACAALRGESSRLLRICRQVFLEDKSPDWVAEDRTLLPNEVKSILKRGARLLVKHYGSGSRQ
jgi:hypothetical protein